MKLRRLITRRRAKWVGVISSGLLVAIAIGTLFARYTYLWVSEGGDGPGCLIGVGSGSLHFVYEPRDSSYAGSLAYMFDDFTGFSKRSSTEWVWWFIIDLDPGQMYWLIVPLWFPLVLIAIPTVYLWHTDRRAKPWQCAKCRYDLRGLEGGVCPECGWTTTESHSTQD